MTYRNENDKDRQGDKEYVVQNGEDSPRAVCVSRRCPVEDTGMNSVSPATRPSRIACRIVVESMTVCPELASVDAGVAPLWWMLGYLRH